jgi:hypothetical protein
VNAAGGHPRRRREHALAALVLSAFIVVFLGSAIVRYGTSLFTPADIAQVSSLTRVDGAHRVANPLLGDVALQMEPWLLFQRDELRAGRMPLWNPYNGGGTPHFANCQSAVLSPFSLPFYVFDLKTALLVSAFLKLFGLGFFTYLYLREIELAFLAALTGGVAFMFAGHNVLLLGFPHPAAMITLPAALFFVERAFNRFEIARWRPGEHPLRAVGALPFLGLGITLTVGLFTGQPEPYYFALVVVTLYVALKLARIGMRHAPGRSALGDVVPLAAAFVATGVLAAGMAAIQLLPFFEYLRMSQVLVERSHAQTPLSLVTWPLLFFPNLLGNPSTLYNLSDQLPPPNFETANLIHAGGIVMFLAAISLLFARRNHHHMFFAALAAVWFVYAHDIGGAWHFFSTIPTVHSAPINRSQGVWEFGLACCAAFAVHHWMHAHVPVRSMLFASTLFAGIAMLAAFAFGAQHLCVQAYAYFKDLPTREQIYQYSAPHMRHVAMAFLPGVLALAASLLAPQGRLRRLFAWAILVSVFLQTGYIFRGYNSVTDERLVFPRTSAIADLTRTVGDRYVGILGDDTLLPETNIVYGVSMPASYDGMWIRRYDELYRAHFGESNNWRLMRKASLQAFELFGVEFVLGKGDWLEVDTPFAMIPDNPRAFYETGEILPGKDVVQAFTCTRDRLQVIRLFAGSLGRVDACTLHVALEDPRDGRIVAAHDFDCRSLPPDAAARTSLVFAFDPIADSRGRSFRLRVSSPDARPGTAASLWCRSDWRHWVNVALWRATPGHESAGSPLASDVSLEHDDLRRWRLARGSEVLEGGLFFNYGTSRDRFRELHAIGEHIAYAIDASPSRYHAVARAIAADNPAQALARTLAVDFDPARTVVLDRADLENVPALRDVDDPGPVRVIEETPTRVHLVLEHPQPGWLVTAKPWYPGWIARVDGERREPVRANYAFAAVRIGTGESDVVLEYDPPSFRRGRWISLASAAVFALLLATVFGPWSRAVSGA